MTSRVKIFKTDKKKDADASPSFQKIVSEYGYYTVLKNSLFTWRDKSLRAGLENTVEPAYCKAMRYIL